MYIFDRLTNKIYRVNEEPIFIGRARECEIILNDLDVSRKHGKIFLKDGELMIEDLNSKNGIFVNELPINPETPIPLKKGDRVEIGRFFFEVLDQPPALEVSGIETNTDLLNLNMKTHIQSLITEKSSLDAETMRIEALNIIKKLNTIYEYITLINSSLELEDILDSLLKKTMDIAGAERGAILINKYPENILLPIISYKIMREIQAKTSFSLSRAIIERVQEEKKIILIEDAMVDDSINSESVIASRIRSVLASPILFSDQMLGIIYLDHREKSGVFNTSDISFFNSIVSIASIAINSSNTQAKILKRRDQYYKDKIFKNFELYKQKILIYLKEGLAEPIDTISKLSEMEYISKNTDLQTIFNRLRFDLSNIVSELINTELPTIESPVFDSAEINIISLVSEIYKNIFPYAYLKDIKVFYDRPSAKKLFMKGDLSYIKDIISEVLFNLIDVLEENSEITLNVNEKKHSLEIEYESGPILMEERNISDFMDEKVLMDIKSFTNVLKHRVLFSKQKDRKARISFIFSTAHESGINEDTINISSRFGSKFQYIIEKDENRLLLFFKKDRDYHKLISDYIKLIGFNVAEALTRDEGMEKLESFMPSIVLFDYSLLEDNVLNIDIIRQIKEKKNIPIILLSGTKNISREIFGSGIDDIMFVPFRLEELELRIVHSLESSIFKKHTIEIEKIETVKAMIASISHELNNPLTTASINTELIKMTAPQAGEYAERILSSLEKMKDIVQKLSNLKKVSFKDYLKDHKMLNLNPNMKEEL